MTKARLIYWLVFAAMLAFFLARCAIPRGGSSGGAA
jgi:hypothetical protein